jgi:hypothetical protein
MIATTVGSAVLRRPRATTFIGVLLAGLATGEGLLLDSPSRQPAAYAAGIVTAAANLAVQGLLLALIWRLAERRGWSLRALTGWQAVGLLAVAACGAAVVVLLPAAAGLMSFRGVIGWTPAIAFLLALALGPILDPDHRSAWRSSVLLLFGVQLVITAVLKLL